MIFPIQLKKPNLEKLDCSQSVLHRAVKSLSFESTVAVVAKRKYTRLVIKKL